MYRRGDNKVMENKTILIAETNKPQDKFIEDALIRNNVPIEIFDVKPSNSDELKTAIISLKPDIVITNERKKDRPATDVIYEIQKDKNIKQPIIILISGYIKEDINYIINSKQINVHTFFKPYDFNNLAKYIKNILAEEF